MKELISDAAMWIVALIGVTFISALFASGNLFDKYLVKQTASKPSITQSYAYLDETRTYTSEEVVSEIINSGSTIKIYCNGNPLNADNISKARSFYSAGISYLKNTFVNPTYQKNYIFSETGEMTGINYK